jgi:HD-GYP domain-containing protein (c-di-GMP phosphodiesterase class II)
VGTAGPDEPLRLAELMAALSLATDLGLGRPLEHELGVCLAALELADRLGSSPEERSDVYYVALLAHVGCTGAAPHFARWAGGDEIHFLQGMRELGLGSEPTEDVRHFVRRLADDRPLPERARLVARLLAGGDKQGRLMAANLCEGATVLAERLNMPEPVCTAVGQLMERWDGKGIPSGRGGDELARPMRILAVAHDAVVLAGARDREAMCTALSRRRGRGYDPDVVDAALAEPDELLATAQVPDAWARVLDAEPPPVATIGRAGLSSIARAFGEFVDVKLSFLHGHSARVAESAAAAAQVLSCPAAQVAEIRTAGFVHDIGRVAVPNGIWDKAGPLSTPEFERVRLHPYYSERVLARAELLTPLAALASSHHERLDGSGYHRGATAPQLDTGSRLLAAADVLDAMTHERPYRRALDAARARAELGEMVEQGRLDKRAVDAVLEAASAPPLEARQGYPAGLSEREVEVLRLVAKGRTSREIAQALVISEKTAGHHVEHIYAKTGVSTRVGAALFAMRHDLVD